MSATSLRREVGEVILQSINVRVASWPVGSMQLHRDWSTLNNNIIYVAGLPGAYNHEGGFMRPCSVVWYSR